MMEWIVAILVVVIVLMAAYIRGQWKEKGKISVENIKLCNQLDAANRTEYQLRATVESLNDGIAHVAAVVGEVLDPAMEPLIVKYCTCAGIMSIPEQLHITLRASVEKIHMDAASGNRAELEYKLRELYNACHFEDYQFDEFLREFVTFPTATYNRIALHVLRQQK